MAIPKRRQSSSRRNKRRAQDKAGGVPALAKDAKTGEFTVRHRVSKDGSYRGKQILTVKVKEK